MIVIDGAGNIIHRRRDPAYSNFYGVAAFENGDFALYGSFANRTDTDRGKVLRFNAQYELMDEIPVVVPPSPSDPVIKAITERGLYLGINQPAADTINFKLIDWDANERFSVDADRNHFYNLFGQGFFHEFGDGSFVLGRPDRIEKFDASGQSLFRHIPLGKDNYSREIIAGPNDGLFISYLKYHRSFGTTVKTETDAAGNTTSRIVVLVNGTTQVGYEQLAKDGSRVRIVAEQPLKYLVEADHLPNPDSGLDFSGLFEVKSVQPGPCEIEDAVVMPDGLLISHSKLCEEEDFGRGAAPYTYTTRAY